MAQRSKQSSKSQRPQGKQAAVDEVAEHLRPKPAEEAPQAPSMGRSNPGENHPGERNGRVTTYPDGSKRVDN